jgi:hypothetical protein
MNEYEEECMKLYGRTTVDIKEFNLKFDINHGTYEQDRTSDNALQEYLRYDERFRRAYSRDYTNDFFGTIQDKAKLREPLHISIMGVTRTFTNNNFIYTRQGWKRPSDIQEGEEVLSWNFDLEKYEWGKSSIIKRPRDTKEKFYTIEFSDGRTIELGENHPIFTSSKGWRKAFSLKEGIEIPIFEKVLRSFCKYREDKRFYKKPNNLMVRKVTILKVTDDVIYDIYVEKNNNFFLNGILTHNSGKSYTALSILAFRMALMGKLVTPSFICANAFRFLQKIQTMDLEATKDTMFLRDEDKDAVYGTGSIAKRAKLQDVANIIAKHNISTLSLCPIKFAAQEEAHAGLRTFGRNFTNGTVRMMFYNLQESKTLTRPMGMVYIPIFTKMLPEWYAKPLEAEYSKLKDAWIEEEIKGNSDVLAEVKRGQAQALFKDPMFVELKKKDEKLAYATQRLGSEWTKQETLEIIALVELLKKGVVFQ